MSRDIFNDNRFNFCQEMLLVIKNMLPAVTQAILDRHKETDKSNSSNESKNYVDSVSLTRSERNLLHERRETKFQINADIYSYLYNSLNSSISLTMSECDLLQERCDF